MHGKSYPTTCMPVIGASTKQGLACPCPCPCLSPWLSPWLSPCPCQQPTSHFSACFVANPSACGRRFVATDYSLEAAHRIVVSRKHLNRFEGMIRHSPLRVSTGRDALDKRIKSPGTSESSFCLTFIWHFVTKSPGSVNRSRSIHIR